MLALVRMLNAGPFSMLQKQSFVRHEIMRLFIDICTRVAAVQLQFSCCE